MLRVKPVKSAKTGLLFALLLLIGQSVFAQMDLSRRLGRPDS